MLPYCTTPGSGTIVKEGPLDAINDRNLTPVGTMGNTDKGLGKELIDRFDFTRLSLTFFSKPALQDSFFSMATMRPFIELKTPACSFNFFTIISNSVFVARDLFI